MDATPSSNRWTVAIIYSVFFLSALLYRIELLEKVLNVLSGPFLIVVACYLWYIVRRQYVSQSERFHFTVFSASIVIAGYAIEAISVKTGWLFGSYTHSNIMQPQIDGVPIAVGFSLYTAFICSHAISQRFIPISSKTDPIFRIIITGLFMVFFDHLAEPSIAKLGFWHWENGVPIQNFIGWFFVGLLFATAGTLSRTFNRKITRIAIHLYFAHISFFTIIIV